MSVINQFNRLGGTIATRSSLKILQDKAYDEHQAGNKAAFEVWERIQNLLDAYPNAQEFDLEILKPIQQPNQLGKIEVVKKGNELQYFSDKTKIATVRDNGLITWHKNKLPAGARKEIRKAAKIIGLACPEISPDESMLGGLEFIENDVLETGTLGKPVSQNDIYNYITDLIINTIKEVGHLPWQKEWVGSGAENGARNYVTKKPYSGANYILNFDVKFSKGKGFLVPIKFEQPYYLTFNQIEEAGATLKAGSKARRVIYYTMLFSYKKDKLQFSTNDTKKLAEFVKTNGITPEDLKVNLRQIPVIKYYNVFRADDCTGLKFPPKSKPKNTTPIQEAQAIIDGYPNPPKFTFVGDKAYYQPDTDKVNMPKMAAFSKEEFYYSTFFHEIIHSTGAKKRLNRDFSGNFGDKSYAFEELIAELGAVFLCGESGILFTTRENSAKYLKSWNNKLVSALENDNRFFLKASAQAQKAADLILNKVDISKAKPMSRKKARKSTNETPKSIEKTINKKASNSQKPTKIIKLTASQKKRYDKELASDNWKKYSKNPDGNKRFFVKSNQYLKKGKAATYYYVVNAKNQTMSLITKKPYRGIDMRHYKFDTRISAQKFADELHTIKPKIEVPNQKPQLSNPIVEETPIPVVPVYINTEPNEVTNDIIEAVKETIPAQAVVVHQPESRTKNRLMQMQFDSLTMDDGWEKLLQNPATNMKIAIWGAPKNGKTAASLQMANYLSKFGKVLYNFADQGFNKSTQDLWISSGLDKNFNAEPSDISNTTDLENEIKSGEYKFVFIDMISDYIRTEKIKPEEFKERFIKQFPETSFILIFEVTKGGNFKGDQGWTHLVDAIMTVEDFLIENRGRYGTGERIIWEEGLARFNPKRYAEWLEANASENDNEEIQLTDEVERI